MVAILKCVSNLQSLLKSPPSTTGAAEETVGGSLNTAEKEVWLKCFKQWMSGEEHDDDDADVDDDEDNDDEHSDDDGNWQL